MGNIFNILMVGVGGQGIIMASDIVSLTAMYGGRDVKKSEIHGMSQRGGSVFSHIRIGEKVHSPLIAAGEADILFSLEEMETLRWIGYANEKSIIICMKTRINPAMVEEYPAGIEEEIKRASPKACFIDPEPLRKEIGNAKFLNVALIGLLSGFVDFNEDCWEKAIREKVPEDTFEGNWNAFHTGKKLYREAFE
ncbi:MAG: indolepyruvate oxidoreductase subunit beta [Spirochaetales bacterium]|nr:indolepyruvate oxidoreductase subunit beta [Spirochaetales bacterium]